MEVLQERGVQLHHRAATLYFSTRSNRPHVKRVVCTNSPTPALALTNTPIRTPTPVLHISNTNTNTNTSSNTNTNTNTPSPTPIPRHTPTPTPIPRHTPTPTPTPTQISPTPTPTRTPSRTPARPKFRPWLIVGIGNPGNKFHKTRHNVGFEMIDAIAEAEGIKLNTIQQKALTGKGEIGPTQVLLAKPQTYVNLTGQSVGPLAAYYRIPVQQILVIFDDMDLEFGLMRLATKGGHGSSNGLKSIIENLKGCRTFPRLRIGIGNPPGTMDPGAFVLQKFSTEEREEIDELLARGPVLIREMISEGIEKTAEAWNQLRKSRMQLSPEELEILKQI